MRGFIIKLLKVVIPLAIIVWLIWDVQTSNPEVFAQLRDGQKDWLRLAGAALLVTSGVMLTFVRWWVLVRTLQIPFALRDAFRLGFLGYLLNFVSLGSTGGDLFKAIFIARKFPKRRAQAIATIVVDRLIGLYALFVVTSVAIYLADLSNPPPEIVAVCQMTYLLTAIGGVAILVLLLPGFTTGPIARWFGSLPKVGPTLASLTDAMRMYGSRKGVLAGVFLMCLVVHCVFVLGLYLAAVALTPAAPTLGEHFIIIPLGMVAGALPFAPAGLGAFEAAMTFLYKHVSSTAVLSGLGLIVALCYRVITVLIAIVGVGFYLADRRQVSAVLREAEASQQPREQPATAAPEQGEVARRLLDDV